MLKSLANLVYKTPWWVIFVGGFLVFLILAAFTFPFNVIRLSEAGANKAEKQAIQREIDHTFGDSALSVAERVVTAMAARTTDPARKAELAQALKDISEARREMFSAEKEVSQAVTEASREAAREARRLAKESAAIARDTAKQVASEARDAAREKLRSLREARKDAEQAQRRVGIKDDAALAPFDRAINDARASERAADEALVQLGRAPPQPAKKDTGSAPKETNAPVTPPQKTIPNSGGSETQQAPKPESGAVDEGLSFDLGTKDKRIRGTIHLDDAHKPLVEFDHRGPVKNTPALIASDPVISSALRDDIRRKVTSDFRRVGIGSALILTFIPLFILLLIAKFYIGRSRAAQEVATVKTKEAESANLNRQIVEAKLMALQAQVEPHFLYNTLANVQALTEVDPQQANRMTGHLIQYLRSALPKMRENISTVGQELELVGAYLNILKMRMGGRLEFAIDVPDHLMALPFPPLMLPSLVENAIKHGLEPQREGGRIDITATRVGEGDSAKLRLIVADTGRGFSDAPIQAGGGVGLANIRERLLALFGERARLTLEANSPRGVIATIETPADGASVFTNPGFTGQAQNLRMAAEEPPKNWREKTISVASKTHRFWASMLTKVFFGLIAILGVLFILGLMAVAAGEMPLTISGVRVSGLEGMALGTVVMVTAFALLSIVALIVVAIIYGLGFLFLALAIGVPIIIIIASFPALAPFAFVGFIAYWLWWRKRKKPTVIEQDNQL
jgi:hypothetical protein